jgi:hypothetical protein
MPIEERRVEFANFLMLMIKNGEKGKLFLQKERVGKMENFLFHIFSRLTSHPPEAMNNYSYLYYLLSNDSTLSERE